MESRHYTLGACGQDTLAGWSNTAVHLGVKNVTGGHGIWGSDNREMEKVAIKFTKW